MAFAAFTAVCSYGGIPSNNSYHAPILGRPLWSESPTTNVTSTNAAPDADGRLGNPMVTCYATADSYVAFGTNPDPTATVATATTSARMLVPASAAGVPPTQVWVNRGDRFKWVAA